MTGKERAAFRAQANSLEPIIQIGKEGISDNLLTQISDALDARELIKIRVHLETSPLRPRECAGQIAQALSAEVIQVIGGIIVLYRKSEKKEKAARAKAKKAKAKKVKIMGLRQRNAAAEQKKAARTPYNRARKTPGGRSGR
ncbi:MAG: YhbY family RNA-binding protein [Clostridiales bacterium]|nr:YhbY family RNA-binding protein [Clostridiales bacterium]